MKKQTVGILIAVLVVLAAGVYLFIEVNNVKNTAKETNNITEDQVVENKLVGKTWTWERTLLNDETGVFPKEKEAFTITFNEGGEFNGTTDCNLFFGQYEGNLVFSNVGMTEMYCEGSQEQYFIGTLNEVQKYMFDEDGNLVLLLKLDAGSMIFN
jgi:heat shock protein HslJ